MCPGLEHSKRRPTEDYAVRFNCLPVTQITHQPVLRQPWLRSRIPSLKFGPNRKKLLSAFSNHPFLVTNLTRITQSLVSSHMARAHKAPHSVSIGITPSQTLGFRGHNSHSQPTFSLPWHNNQGSALGPYWHNLHPGLNTQSPLAHTIATQLNIRHPLA